jgi:solute carrier family 25 carnitine/acylcarnitine transporter 20/29
MIKVKLQVQSVHNPVYTGALDCLRKTIKANGIRGLYRGMLAPVLMATPVTAVAFYSLAVGKKLQLDNPNQEPTMPQYVNAGLFCGFCVGFFYAPAERLKCLLQVQKSSGGVPKYTGLYDCFKKVFKESGVRGVYRGLGPTLIREIIGGGAWYVTYEGLLRSMRSRDSTRDEVGTIPILLAGGAAGFSFWVLMFPVDVLKTRLQVSVEAYPNGARGLLKEVIKKEGVQVLFRGYVPALIRAVVVHAALFVGYEFTMKSMNWMFP